MDSLSVRGSQIVDQQGDRRPPQPCRKQHRERQRRRVRDDHDGVTAVEFAHGTHEEARRDDEDIHRTAGEPVPVEARTPYDMPAPDGIRYVSHADWLCPTHCIEPARCPVIRGPRTWEMSDTLREMTRRLGRVEPVAGPVVLRCRHRAFGVGMFDVEEVLAADALVTEAGRSGAELRILVGTVSSCHGAVGMLSVGAGEVPRPSILHGGSATDSPAAGPTPRTLGKIGNG